MPRKRQLLIVEDEEAIRTGLVDVFVYHGFEVAAVADGREGLERAQVGDIDLVLLDVMLPSMNGFDVCDAIRQHDRDLRIIMLTAKVDDDDIVNGLKLGADDYIGKPFGVQELVLRVEAVLRRSKSLANLDRHLDLGDGLVVDTESLSGKCNETELVFTRREIEILCYLSAYADRPVPRDELLTEAWGYKPHMDIETRTVDIHIAKLRRKIEVDPKFSTRLLTVRGAGDRLMAG